jgi:hypothetical protein
MGICVKLKPGREPFHMAGVIPPFEGTRTIIPAPPLLHSN